MNDLILNAMGALGAAIVAYLLFFIDVKRKELKARTSNTLYIKYIDQIAETINAVVMQTNQTYVDTLKAEGKFDFEAQKKALLNATHLTVLNQLSQESIKYLQSITEDVSDYLITRIEAEVNALK